jgi:hypothetical protein
MVQNRYIYQFHLQQPLREFTKPECRVLDNFIEKRCCQPIATKSCFSLTEYCWKLQSGQIIIESGCRRYWRDERNNIIMLEKQKYPKILMPIYRLGTITGCVRNAYVDKCPFLIPVFFMSCCDM